MLELLKDLIYIIFHMQTIVPLQYMSGATPYTCVRICKDILDSKSI